MNGSTTNCSISARPAYFGSRRIAPVAAISHVKVGGAQPVVEILRPAHRHSEANNRETIGLMRMGAPRAPFLAQLFAQEQFAELTTTEVADRYEAATALTDEPSRVWVATL